MKRYMVLLTLAAGVLMISAAHFVDAQERLAATSHPPLPGHLSQYWLVPDVSASRTSAGRGGAALAGFVRGVTLVASGDYAAGLPLVSGADLGASPLTQYAQYYRGIALAGLSRHAEADAALTAVLAQKPQGVLKEAATLTLADVLIASGSGERAEDLLEDLSDQKLSVPEEVLVQLGRAEEAIGHREHAVAAYRRVYYEFPLSTQAVAAQQGLERLQTLALLPPDRFALELKRAEQLFAARRWAQARAAFAPLAAVARGDDRELVALRLAECDHYLDRHRAARDALQPYLAGASRRAEARFFHLTATRALGDHATYVALARRLVADEPRSEWAAETLNNLASHYIIRDEDAAADEVFRDLYRRFPKHRYAERAAWKIGWRAYMSGRYAETAALFDEAAAAFPRADYRPSWLYWSGRARDQLRDQPTANARYRLAVTDYQNTYYGRLASALLASRKEPPVAPNLTALAPTPPAGSGIPTDTLVRELIALELYDDALREVRYAQRVWGDTSQLQATVAWIRHHQAASLKATERFNALRGAINTMRRAYPHFMAAGGEQLPPDVLRIIFPLDYWPLIRKYSDAHDLDPYLMAALMAQESTFTPEIRSAANAYGLMQVIPGTGRIVARQLGIRPFRTSMLTQPETNVRIGMKYFKDMVTQFGGAHFALAGYNAGPHRVRRWRQESPGLAQDEFIDNIPYAETQNYVKRILGTAEDYRRLYGGGVLDPNAALSVRPRPSRPRR